MNFLNIDNVDWKNLLQHQSELVRVDENLKKKQNELKFFTTNVQGWSPLAAQTNLEQQRMIYSMRSMLQIFGILYFDSYIISKYEYIKFKESFLDRENFVNDDSYLIVNNLSAMDLIIFINKVKEKFATKQFYKKLFTTLIRKDLHESDVEKIMEKIQFVI